ncbi:N-acetylmuramoyl-L-alanine amidase [Schinkia azotoformans]|uniref:N-acetylmuramoyl-L-alanine amidase n=2 Tax=Schinkia azotoformans TaxID=1454 RepID=K6E2W1_SCHAZ|nr:N-acetylmuramoyl-L-alanine amidase [Schinkia azotoformans]EKN67516.1 prophage LambdaBa01, N-acetylmuramoyl-L-alanine amidase, family 2 [Schinkia azotoformans LMG 9581]MEC1637323.1 N-acetylmuramoyl-L-alanine amidase [Schinkia azotoformans]MEC1943727.1 N-acetylmuramoyl-L-alanine amidase [Schinkia azotoformans]
MIQARQMLVKESQQKTKCPNQMDAKYITIHNTANDASANNEVQYMINNTNQVSYHYAIDDKEVVQGIPLNHNAWHCGDGSAANSGNRTSIGVEICYSKSGGERYTKAEALATKFIAQLLHERNWGIERVKKHQDWSGKYCPHRILAEGRWQAVLNAIQMELNELKKSNEKKESEEMQKVNIIAGTKLIDGVNINGVTYAPVRELSELLGKKVEWDQKTSTVTLK